MNSLIADVLAAPGSMVGLSLEGWDRLLREARATHLVARLAYTARVEGLASGIPEVFRDYLLAHEELAVAQHEAVRYEAEQILAALRDVGCPVVFLKGSAYVLSGNPVAEGRLLGDIDVLVPKESLDEAELMLRLAGWSNHDYSDYDQRYYRRWMHELPAMQHAQRRTALDLHHTILPPTARRRIAPAKLLAAAVPAGNLPGAKVLSDADMLIHCACHLFHEGEFQKGLRDLFDFSLLLAMNSTSASAESLVGRVVDLDLGWPVYLATRYSRQVFRSGQGLALMALLEEQLRPSRPVLGLFDAMFARAFLPHHPLYSGAGIGLARWMLYVRSHWLRMPPHLLAYHLAYKAWLRLRGDDDDGQGGRMEANGQ